MAIGRLGSIALAVITGSCLLAVHWVFGPTPTSWIYDRLSVANGELWRQFTSHSVHIDSQHALLNSVALVLVIACLHEVGVRRLFGLLLAAAALWTGKLALEWTSGGSLLLSSAWPTWTGAHLSGALGGSVAAPAMITIETLHATDRISWRRPATLRS